MPGIPFIGATFGERKLGTVSLDRGGDHRDKNILFESIQVNSIVISINKTREIFFDFGVLNPPHLTRNFAFWAQKRLKMATGRKGYS